MSEETTLYERTALISEIAKRQPGIGRTALMKYLYLLQTVKDIDLGYRFDLYSYGPFDSTVLSDITTAVSWGGAKQTVCHYPSGIGYELSEGESAEQVLSTSRVFLKEVSPAIDWAVSHFRGCGAGEMELLATMVYVDQEAFAVQESITPAQLIKRALEIKPRYGEDFARAKLTKLFDAGALSATLDLQ
ncbi:hypothetical protein BH11ARM2_BH11ARM2_01830 [soil metagenome]